MGLLPSQCTTLEFARCPLPQMLMSKDRNDILKLYFRERRQRTSTLRIAFHFTSSQQALRQQEQRLPIMPQFTLSWSGGRQGAEVHVPGLLTVSPTLHLHDCFLLCVQIDLQIPACFIQGHRCLGVLLQCHQGLIQRS